MGFLIVLFIIIVFIAFKRIKIFRQSEVSIIER